jgi:hypothetical protein
MANEQNPQRGGQGGQGGQQGGQRQERNPDQGGAQRQPDQTRKDQDFGKGQPGRKQ